MNQPDNQKLAAVLVGGTPMAYKAYPDGSLVVIGPDGRKFRFTQQEVETAKAKLVSVSTPKRPASSSRTKKPAAGGTSSSMKDDVKKTPSSAKR